MQILIVRLLKTQIFCLFHKWAPFSTSLALPTTKGCWLQPPPAAVLLCLSFFSLNSQCLCLKTLKGFLRWHTVISTRLMLCFQNYWDTRAPPSGMDGTLSVEVPRHRQEQLMQILIVHLLKTQIFCLFHKWAPFSTSLSLPTTKGCWLQPPKPPFCCASHSSPASSQCSCFKPWAQNNNSIVVIMCCTTLLFIYPLCLILLCVSFDERRKAPMYKI